MKRQEEIEADRVRASRRHAKLEPGRWHRHGQHSVACVGGWTLRVHHVDGGWSANLCCLNWRMIALPAPIAARADAERAILESTLALHTRMEIQRESLCQPIGKFRGPSSDPGWQDPRPGRWYRSVGIPRHQGPEGMSVSQAWCGVFWLRVVSTQPGDWAAYVTCGEDVIFHDLIDGQRTRKDGEALLLAGVRMRLSEIGDALTMLRADPELLRA